MSSESERDTPLHACSSLRRACHLAVLRQVALHHCGVYRHRLLERHHVVGQALAVGYDAHAVAIRAVAQDEQFIRRSDGAAQHGLNAIGSAALHQHGRVVFRVLGGQRHQVFPDHFYNAHVVIFIPGAPIAQHGFLHGLGRGQRAGGQ